MRNSKKLVLLSALCLAVAILLLGYSAYGWMTMSRSVRAVGQNVEITVPNNLMISLSPTGPWSESVTVELNDLVKELTKDDPKKFTGGKFYLLPASSYSGFNGTFWQTGRAKNDGSAADDAVFLPGDRIKWSENTSAFDGYFIDVPLYFMTDSENDVKVALSSEGTTVISVGAEDGNIVKTVRAAFLNQSGDKSSMDAEEPLVFAGYDSTGVFEGKVITGADTKTAPKYLTFTDGKTEQLFTVEKNRAVKQIIVRIWVEGQDKSCVAKIGGHTFSLSLKFVSCD